MSYPNYAPYYNPFGSHPSYPPNGYPAFAGPSYPMGPPHGGHGTYAQPQNGAVPFIPPSPGAFDEPQQLDRVPSSSKKRPKRATTLPSGLTKPLKSAMKKSRASEEAPIPIPPPASVAPPHPTSKSKGKHARHHSMPSPQSISGSPMEMTENLQHLFVTFQGDDELRIHFCSQPAMEEIRRTILPLWPDGVADDQTAGFEWRIKFRNMPWKSSDNAPAAFILVLRLFTLFAHRGFALQGALNLGSPPPQLVFVASAPASLHFFAMYISRKGSRATIIGGPPILDEQLEPSLRERMGPNLASNRKIDSSIRVLDLKVNSSGNPVIESPVFVMHLMSCMSDLGFHFDTSVPLGRKKLGSSARRELLIFQSAITA